MDRSIVAKIRSYPRVFIDNVSSISENLILDKHTYNRLHNVLRLGKGDIFSVFSGTGSIFLLKFHGKEAELVEEINISPKADLLSESKITLCVALLKGEKLEHIVKICSEMGVSKFVFFHASRSVMKWNSEKIDMKLERLRSIAKESCLVTLRPFLPEFEYYDSLKNVLDFYPNALILSEQDSVHNKIPQKDSEKIIVVGPEGGWAPSDLSFIENRSFTLGVHIYRSETAAILSVAHITNNN